MSQSNETELFSKAFVAQGNGDLVRVTDFSWTYRNNGKQVHTLREDGAGITFAPRESEVSFNFPIGKNGFERDYVKAIQDGKIVQLRLKIPGGRVYTLNGAYTQITVDGPLDDAVKGSVSFVGKLEKQRAIAA